jgi:hypothetical protein
VLSWCHFGGTMSQRQRSKLPLLVIMAGGICFALGRHTLGLILSGVGAMLFVLGSSSSDAP